MKNQDQKEQSIIFLHIPKTAGQTLHTIIEKQYNTNQIFTIGRKTQERIDEFRSLSEIERKNIKVIKGHMPFGMHKFMPQPCHYITLLRNPIDRIISSYYYVLRSPLHYLHKYVVSKQMSLKEFVSSGVFTDVDNGQTRRLSGVSAGRLHGSKTIHFGDCSPNLLDDAKENIVTYFSVVGIAEKFDESLLMIKQALGWKRCFYVKKNVTINRPSMQDIKEDTLEVIREYNQLDIELYEFCRSLFEESIAKQGISFFKQLEMFRQLNSWYCQATHLKSLSKSGIKRLNLSVKNVVNLGK